MPASPPSRKIIFSWAFYDFANSAFTTLVVTFIYSTYFVSLAPTPEAGTQYWSLGISVSAILIALLSPLAGTVADQSGHRKRYLFTATMLGILLTAGLYFPVEGQLMWALAIFVCANVAVEVAQVFYNAYLPEISHAGNVGKVSGYGWGCGYIGGLLCLGAALVFFVQPEVPPFGLSVESGQHIRATNILVALWFAVFSIPTFLFLKDSGRKLPSAGTSPFRQTIDELKKTMHSLKRFRQVVRFLIARLLYNDALVTLIGFGGIYARVTFGFTFQEVLIFGIVLNVAAALGAVLFGFIDDKIGGKKTILISIVGFIVATLAVIVTDSRLVFWAGGVLIGILIGPNQSASRSLFARFVPKSKESEFFGFYAFSGKLTAFLGPLLLGSLTRIFDSQRVGFSVIIILFALGMSVLLTVDEEAGIAAKQRED